MPMPPAPSFVVTPPFRRRGSAIFRRPRHPSGNQYTCCAHNHDGTDRVAPDEGRHHVSYTTTRKVRLKRSDTCHSASWTWNGGARRDEPGGFQYQAPFLLRRMFKQAVRHVLAFPKTYSDAIAARLVRRLLQALFAVLQRSWYAEELVIEYGITDPHPDDKAYVDPLMDWQPSPITYYHDSFGHRVYLCANSPNGLAIALEFREAEFDHEYDQNDARSDDNDNAA